MTGQRKLAATLLMPLIIFGIGASPRSVECRINVIDATRNSIKVALDMYRLDTASYPTESQGLKALVTDPGVDGWHGPYIRAKDDERNAEPACLFRRKGPEQALILAE